MIDEGTRLSSFKVEREVVNAIRDNGIYAEGTIYSNDYGTFGEVTTEEDSSKSDVIAIFNGNCFLFKCDLLEMGNEPYDFTEEGKQLSEVRQNIRRPPTLHTRDSELKSEVYIAVEFSHSDHVYVLPHTCGKVTREYITSRRTVSEWAKEIKDNS